MIISHFKPGDEKSTGKTNKLNELKIGRDYTVKKKKHHIQRYGIRILKILNQV
jgi:hypothetical protein